KTLILYLVAESHHHHHHHHHLHHHGRPPFFPAPHFLCFSSLSAPFEPGPSPGVWWLEVWLLRNILSSPFSASVR
uniref:Uncharacterized protein n=1 Tax=Pygocentrus nattereri TaxID=42514 RepID=A0AAR2KUW4_PYGNA